MLGPEVLTVTVGVGLLTVWVRVATTELKLVSPLYVAVTRSLPPGSDEVVRVATPLTTLGLPSVEPPLVKVTVPVTLLGRVSVNVTAVFTGEGLSEDVSVVVGVAFATFWVTFPVAVL